MRISTIIADIIQIINRSHGDLQDVDVDDHTIYLDVAGTRPPKNIKSGNTAAKPATSIIGDIYFDTQVNKLYTCKTTDVWTEVLPAIHAGRHENGNVDEISIAGLSGELADEQKSAWAKVSGKPSTFAPSAHAASHENGGGDEIDVSDLAGLPNPGVGIELTVAMFQAVSVTGTCTTPGNINDNNTTSYAAFTSPNQYVLIDFEKVIGIRRFRYAGMVDHNFDGEYKIQYYNLYTHVWVDWKVNIPTRGSSFSGFETVTYVLTDKIKIIATIIDSGVNRNDSGEFEIKY